MVALETMFCVAIVPRCQTIGDLHLPIVWGRQNARQLLGRQGEPPLTKQRPLHFLKGDAFLEIVRSAFSPP